MKRRWLLGGAAAVALIAGVVVWVIFGSGRSNKPGVQATASPANVAGVAFKAPLAQQIAGELTSGDESRVEAVVALPAGQHVPELVQQLHALRSLTVDPASVHDNGDGTATAVFVAVDATGKATRWNTSLTWINNSWKILATPEGS